MKEKKGKEKGKKAPHPAPATTRTRRSARDRAPPLAPTPCVPCSARDLALPRARRAQQPRRGPSSTRAALHVRRDRARATEPPLAHAPRAAADRVPRDPTAAAPRSQRCTARSPAPPHDPVLHATRPLISCAHDCARPRRSARTRRSPARLALPTTELPPHPSMRRPPGPRPHPTSPRRHTRPPPPTLAPLPHQAACQSRPRRPSSCPRRPLRFPEPSPSTVVVHCFIGEPPLLPHPRVRCRAPQRTARHRPRHPTAAWSATRRHRTMLRRS